MDAVRGSFTAFGLQYQMRRTGCVDGDFGVLPLSAWQRYMRGKGHFAGKHVGSIDGLVGKKLRECACFFLMECGGAYTSNATSYSPDSNYEAAKTYPGYGPRRLGSCF